MPRPKWENLPRDPEKQAAYIDKILQDSACKNVKRILSQYDRRRDLGFRSDQYRTGVDLSSPVSKTAAVIQMRGDVSDNACIPCKQRHGPFTECVRIPSEVSGRCANCIYRRASCSHGDGPVTTCIRPSPMPRNVVNSSSTNGGQNGFQPGSRGSDSGIDLKANFSNCYVVLGNLILDRPPKELEERAEKWEYALKSLDARNMTEIRDRPITNLDSAFKEFQAQEQAAWESIGQDGKTPAHLVRPSGSLESPLAHRLNQPSFTTDFPENGETADNTNGCIAMVMGNAYKPNQTLLFDHIHRRDHTSEAITEYNAKILNTHEQFTNSIAESMMAKVEIVYGAKVQRRLLQTHTFEILPLWGDFDGVVLFLDYETNYRNKDPNFLFRRVMLMANHPQNMFYNPRGSDLATRQDKVMAAAAQMVKNTVPLVENYFVEKKWMACVPTLLQKAELRAFGEILEKRHQVPAATVLRQDNNTLHQAGAGNEGSWQLYFHEYPHSNEVLRTLVPPALAALNESPTSEDWKLPTDLPPPILEWFQGQKQILFADAPISSFQDVVVAAERILQQHVPQETSDRLKWIFEKILTHQREHLQAEDRARQQIWHSKFDGRPIALTCGQCTGSLTPDPSPRWAVNRPDVYIIPHRRCSCGYRGSKLVPVDQSIRYTSTAPENLFRPPLHTTEFNLEPYIRQEGLETSDCPRNVNTWCIRCKDPANIINDTEPRWLLTKPARYLEREQYCQRCHEEVHNGIGRIRRVRFVPVMATIPSTYSNALRAFNDRYAELSPEMQLILLNSTLVSSKESRGGKRE